MSKKDQAERQESKQKLYKIDVRSIVENHNPRNPLPDAVRGATINGSPCSLFDDGKGDLWALGTSEKAEERAEYCRIMETDADFVSWATTFLTVGQLEPVEVRDNGKPSSKRDTDGGNTYTLIFGCRRCLAVLYNWAKLGGKGVPWISAVLSPKLNQTGLLHRSIVENIRKDPNPMEGARAVQMALNQGQTVEDVASTYGRSESWVRNMLKLLELPVPVQKKIEERKITVSKALAEKNGHAEGNGEPKATKVSRKVLEERTVVLTELCQQAASFLEDLAAAGGEDPRLLALLVALKGNVVTVASEQTPELVTSEQTNE